MSHLTADRGCQSRSPVLYEKIAIANASVTYFGCHEQYFYEHNKIMTSLGSDFVFQSDATVLEDATILICSYHIDRCIVHNTQQQSTYS